MSRKVHVASLGVGRCFQSSPEDAENAWAELADRGVTLGRSIMAPFAVWKVTAVGDEIEAENALGDAGRFPPNELVVEIPRQGYERLVQQVVANRKS